MGRTDIITPPSPRITIDPQRRAWGIMLVAFAAFCTICLVSGIGIIYFLFQSSVSMDATIQVSRGRGNILGQEPIPKMGVVSNNDQISTDSLSQATILLRDSLNNQQLVASITLRGDTSFTLLRVSRPRFQFTNGQYVIELQKFSGELSVFVPKNLPRGLTLSVLTASGDLIYLRSGGQYILRASDARVQVINQDGDLILKPSNGDVGKSVPANSQGIITYATDPQDVVVSQLSYTNLLSDRTFQDDLLIPSAIDATGQPFSKDWFCKDNSIPSGKATSDIVDGRTVLRFVRDSDATSHGETFCLRSWGGGQSVASFNYLNLRTTFKLNYQSLGTCGQDASECPLMILIEYVDKNGAYHTWYHGFYATVDPNKNYPTQCNSCLQEHERINDNTWFTYDSGNLLNLLTSPDQRAEQGPVTLIDLRLYSSGHQYDVDVSDIALVASLDANP